MADKKSPQRGAAAAFPPHLRRALARPSPLGDQELIDSACFYYSGLSTVADLRGFTEFDLPVGTSLTWLSPAVQDVVMDYLVAGGDVFLDNGAVTAYLKGQIIDVPAVLRRFQAIIAEMTKRRMDCSRLSLVVPDVVGDQRATLDLQRRCRRHILDLIATGADVLVPVQKGSLWPAEALARVRDNLKTDNFRVAVPSNKRAFHQPDLANLLESAHGLRGVHLLGLGFRRASLLRRMRLIRTELPAARVSADATWIRSQAGTGKTLTDAHRATFRADWDTAPYSNEYDETELAGEVFWDGDLSDDQLRRFIQAIGADPKDPKTWRVFCKANKRGRLSLLYQGFDRDGYFAMDVVHEVFDPDTGRELSARARAGALNQTLDEHENAEANARDALEDAEQAPGRRRRGAAKLQRGVQGRHDRQQAGARFTHALRSGETEQAIIRAQQCLAAAGIRPTWRALGEMLGMSPDHLCRRYRHLRRGGC